MTEELLLTLINKTLGFKGVRTVGIGIAKEITDQHCTIEREGSPELFEVRYHSIADQLNSSITIFPKEGSYVMYALIDNSPTDAVVIACSEIDKVVVKVEQTLHEIGPNGHQIKKGADSMKDVLSALIDEIQKIIVINGTSPNVAALEQIRQRFNNIFF